MVGIVREVRSRTDYILETDHSLLRNMSVRYPKHNSDHYLILGCLHSTTLREHVHQLWRRTLPPLRPPTMPAKEDGLFLNLRWMIPNTKAQEARKNT